MVEETIDGEIGRAGRKNYIVEDVGHEDEEQHRQHNEYDGYAQQCVPQLGKVVPERHVVVTGAMCFGRFVLHAGLYILSAGGVSAVDVLSGGLRVGGGAGSGGIVGGRLVGCGFVGFGSRGLLDGFAHFGLGILKALFEGIDAFAGVAHEFADGGGAAEKQEEDEGEDNPFRSAKIA